MQRDRTKMHFVSSSTQNTSRQVRGCYSYLLRRYPVISKILIFLHILSNHFTSTISHRYWKDCLKSLLQHPVYSSCKYAHDWHRWRSDQWSALLHMQFPPDAFFAGLSPNLSTIARNLGGTILPDKDVIRLIWLALVTGIIPATIGTSIPFLMPCT